MPHDLLSVPVMEKRPFSVTLVQVNQFAEGL